MLLYQNPCRDEEKDELREANGYATFHILPHCRRTAAALPLQSRRTAADSGFAFLYAVRGQNGFRSAKMKGLGYVFLVFSASSRGKFHHR